MQLDGYNPLTVATAMFSIEAEADIQSIIDSIGSVAAKHNATAPIALKEVLSKPFRVGQLFQDMVSLDVKLPVWLSKEDFLKMVVAKAKQFPVANYAQNGFWADHWTYDQDLLDNYLSVFPDKEEYVLWEAEPLPSFVSPSVVKPRNLKYEAVAEGERK